MIKNYLLITWRNMMKNKLFIITNVLGMGVAIACCIVGYFTYEYDSTFDANHQNGKVIYRVSSVLQFKNTITHVGYIPLPVGEIVNETFHDADQSTRYYPSRSTFKRENDLFPSNLTYVDGDFFQMFSFDFISGNPSDLKDKASLFISETMAIRLFGTAQDAVGKTITQVYRTELKEVKVSGVFKDQPMNSSFYKPNGSAFMSFENFKDEFKVREDDWKLECTLFIKVNDANRVNLVQLQLQPYAEINNTAREDFQIKDFALERFSSMAHADRAKKVKAWTSYAPSVAAVMGPMVMGVLILLLACFNLTNGTIAISSRRLKEIGIRKVMGSIRSQLVAQFIGETTFICFLSFIVGLVLANFLVTQWNVMWTDMKLTFQYLETPRFLFFAAGLVLFTAIMAGSYPAFYISKFEPISILKEKLKFGGTNYFTRTLLGLQFAISLITIISAFGFLQNARYQRDYNLGYDASASIVAFVDNQSEFDTYRNALQVNHQIVSIAGAKSGILSKRPLEAVKYESHQLQVNVVEVGDNYVQAMGLTLLEGRDFHADSETDQKESILISEKMVRLFGWGDAIGKEVIWRDSVRLVVIGVVKDIYTRGLKDEPEPMMMKYVLRSQYNQIVVRTSVNNVVSVNDFMKQQWSEVFPNRLYNGYMLSTDVQKVIDVNTNIMSIYLFLGVIATMLSANGLYNLLSLNIIKRMREIGVRKVMGASVFNIGWIINKEFVVILVLASAVGSWAGFQLTQVIMGSIWKFHQVVGFFTLINAVSLLVVISCGAIGYKVFSVATMNPVKILRDN